MFEDLRCTVAANREDEASYLALAAWLEGEGRDGARGAGAWIAGERLDHPRLETLVLPGDPAAVDALRGARLPRLARLRLIQLPADAELLARLAEAARTLGEVDVELAFQSEGNPHE